MKKILVTGGMGFIGRALCKNLKSSKFLVNVSTRTNQSLIKESIVGFNVGEIDAKTNWSKALRNTDCVIH